MSPITKTKLSPVSFALAMLLVSCGQSEFRGDNSAVAEQVIEEAPPGVPEQISDTEVHFGDEKVFHIGDGKYSESSCKEQIDTYALTGTRYFFEFEVKEPATAIDVSINKICGVDYPRVSTSRLTGRTPGTNAYPSRPLAVSADKLQLDRLILGPGKYALIVESGIGQEDPGARDHDDFLVGKIAIKADKKIVAGAVRTE